MKIHRNKIPETIFTHLCKGHCVVYVGENVVARNWVMKAVMEKLGQAPIESFNANRNRIDVKIKDSGAARAIFTTYHPSGASAEHYEVMILDSPSRWRSWGSISVAQIRKELEMIPAPSPQSNGETWIYEAEQVKIMHGTKARIYIRSGDQMIELPFYQDIEYKPLT